MATTRDGRWIAFGTQGGDQQDQWTLQFFLNLADFGMNLQEAIEAPRYSLHACSHPSFYPHDAAPGLVRMEDRIDERVRAELAALGHKVETRPRVVRRQRACALRSTARASGSPPAPIRADR